MHKPIKFFSIILFVSLILSQAVCSAAGTAQGKKKKTKPVAVKPVVKKSVEQVVPKKYGLEQEIRPTIVQKEKTQETSTVQEQIGLSVGIKAGSTAGLPGAAGELSYSLQKIIPGAAVKGSVGYITGSGADTGGDGVKIAMVNLDAVYSFELPKDYSMPLNIYVGGGFIYPWKVNKNRGNGAWGAHAFLGSRYALEQNTAIYGELAYTGIKYQADEKALRGVDATLGYSYSF